MTEHNQYKYAYIHATNINFNPACGKIAFRLRNMPTSGTVISSQEASIPDGITPIKSGDLFVCYGCGAMLNPYSIRIQDVVLLDNFK